MKIEKCCLEKVKLGKKCPRSLKISEIGVGNLKQWGNASLPQEDGCPYLTVTVSYREPLHSSVFVMNFVFGTLIDMLDSSVVCFTRFTSSCSFGLSFTAVRMAISSAHLRLLVHVFFHQSSRRHR